ncbi:DUF3179 domain-containing (seleno)protein [Ruegeria arenilitoris]|uniref:DUF3179 domain-containing (seleno)protein n=1 Tax=Ruegeria arenilitoris TaxID=1173585 RepID=UPI00147A5550|nr:DUF3179 domain-containing (seleno)protein [Ruegeria arenilitoris]
MAGNIIFALGIVVSLGIGFVYFRDLGDISQMLLKVKRENMVRFIRHEYRLIGIGLSAFAVSTLTFLFLGGGSFWLWALSALLVLFLYGFPFVWVHLGLRNQLNDAAFFPISEARKYVGPTAPVIVMDHNGHARAHPDAQIMRPHLAGDVDGLGGEDVVMTYCAMANLGQGYTPRIEGKRLDLEVLAQHGNNLILRDNESGEPIQHIYGFREADRDPNADGLACPLRPEAQMKPWPTYRMTFRGFQKAFPDGEVFLNKASSNPLLRLLDMVTEITFGWGIGRQHQEEAPVMDNMDRSDDRLPNKTYVWGITIGKDAACWTDDFVIDNNWIVNATVGGRDVVVSLDPKYESLGVWYNDSGQPVSHCDFWGVSDQGQLQRVETLRAGIFWHVWSEFFPDTDINRVGSGATDSEDVAA